MLPSNVDDPRFSGVHDKAQPAAEWSDMNAGLSNLTPDDPSAEGLYGWFAALVEASLRLVGEVVAVIAQHH
jgi:hypothetical protein